MKRTELKRTTPLKASKALARKTPLQAKTPLARASEPLRRAPLVQKRVKPKLTAVQKRPLVERSGGYCELRIQGVCIGRATDVAHRIGEGMGGRHGAAAEENDRLSVVLHACRPCHDETHQRPAHARSLGWMLLRGSNSLMEPVYYAGRGWRYLDDAGQVLPL